MIVQALVKRYEDTLTVLPGWKRRNVSHALNISETGKLLNIIPLEWDEKIQEGSKTKKVKRKREFVLPDGGVRSSGVKASPLCDDAGYFLGIDEKRGNAKFEAAKTLHLELLKNTNSSSANAIIAYFTKGITSTDIELVRATIPNEKALAQAVFIFQINGEFVDYNDLEISTVWNNHYAATDDIGMGQIRCLVTGKLDVSESIHGKIKLRGGQSAGSNLISANAESFASYGNRAADPAAAIGKYAAFAHVTALNDLLQDKSHHQFIGGDTLVYWAEENSQQESIDFGNFLNMKIEETDDDKLSDIMEKTTRTQHFNFDKCDMKRSFHILCLSPNAARISVRYYYANTFGAIIKNLKAHYHNLEIITDNRTKFTHLPYWVILNETTVTKKADKVAPLLGGQFLHSIIKGTTYPLTLYNAILTRIRAGEDVNQTKAALIKAVLIKNFNDKEVTTVDLNQETNNKSYILGRLFAVLEQLQYRASSGGLNSTIRDRYFTSACANPSNVFPTLLKLSIHHAAKLDNPTFYEKLKGELMVALDERNPFPKALPMEDQGRFILGYYHQRQSFFAKTTKTDI